MNPNDPNVVFGGTGNYGSHIVRSLISKGKKVRVLSRNKQKAKKLLGEEVEIIEGDVTSEETISRTLKNAGSVIISLSAANPKQIRHMKTIERDAVFSIMKCATNERIERMVYLSAYELRTDLIERLNIRPLAETKIEVEDKIRQSGFNWTILGCPPNYDLFFALLNNGRMTVPGGGNKPIACVSREDVGEIAAQAVLRKDLGEMRLQLAGPEALSFPEVASRISKATGKPIKLITIPLPLVNLISFISKPFFPFLRFIYYSLKLMNNFPTDLAEKAPEMNQHLHDIFDYKSKTIEEDISDRSAKSEI